MPNLLPVSRVVAVSVSLTPAGAQAQSLSNLLVLGNAAIIDPVERYRTYSQLTDVANDFGTAGNEYLAASLWFAQRPQPTALIIGRWINAPASGGLRGAPLTAAQKVIAQFNAISTGAFSYSKDGGASVQTTPAINLTGAANLNAVAALVQGSMVGVTVSYNAIIGRFEFTSATTGAASAVGFLTAPATGVDISALLGGLVTSLGSYVFVGQIAETAAAAVANFDNLIGQRWYGLNIPAAVNADHLAVAALIEGMNNKHVYGVTTQDANVMMASATSDIAFQLQALGYSRTLTQFSSSNALAVVSAMGRMLTTDFRGNSTAITLKFKQEVGVIAEQLSTSQANAVEGKNANIFVAYDNLTNIIENGVMANGTFFDIITGTDWAATDIQRSVYNLLYTSTTKIPQTDAGMQLLTTAVEATCAQGVVNGLFAPGIWNSGGFGLLKQGDFMPKGYYVYSPPVNLQNQADRAARMASPIQVAVKLAGAIHSVSVAITVNQ